RHASPAVSFRPAPPPPEISPLSLHDALPICALDPERWVHEVHRLAGPDKTPRAVLEDQPIPVDRDDACVLSPIVEERVARRLDRSEEHTSELQSLTNLVCRLLLEKQKTPHHP